MEIQLIELMRIMQEGLYNAAMAGSEEALLALREVKKHILKTVDSNLDEEGVNAETKETVLKKRASLLKKM